MNFIKRLYLKHISYRYFSKLIFTNRVLSSPNYSIGDFTYGWPQVLFPDSNKKLVIGKYCAIAYGVKIFLGGNHRPEWISTYPFCQVTDTFKNGEHVKDFHASKGDVIIGNDVWIGHGATILSGVTIGDGAVIGANATIAKNVAPYQIVAGNPQFTIRQRFPDEAINELLRIKWWDWEEKKVNENIHLLNSGNINEFIQLHK